MTPRPDSQPQRPHRNWGRRPVPQVDPDGHVITRTGACAFECCSICGFWNGAWHEVTDKGTKVRRSHPTRVPCECDSSLISADPVSIEELGLRPRVLGAIRQAGIADTAQVARMGRRQIAKAPGVGQASVDALCSAIEAAGLPTVPK